MATKKNSYINGQSYYRIRRTIGHEIKDGKEVPIIKNFYGTSKTQAEEKYKNFLVEQSREKETAIDSNKTLGEVLNFYLDNVFSVSSKYKQSTKDLYIYACKRFMDSERKTLMMTPIKSVTPSDIQLAYNRFDAAYSTLQAINKTVRGFVTWAVANQYCTDFLVSVTIPNKKHSKRSDDIIIWTDDEIEKIKESITDERWRLILYFGLYAGLRISEAIAIRYTDIYDDIIHVRQQYYRGEITTPKYGSERDIPLHPELKKELEKHRTWHKAEMKANKYKTDYIFTTQIGTLYTYYSIRQQINRAYKRYGIEPKDFHTYRRTFCTNLCRAGVPIQITSKLMGHKSIDVTMKFYTFVDMQLQFDAINKL